MAMVDQSEPEPIETYLAALGRVEPFPEEALRACVARFGEARRPLRALLDRAAAGKPLDDADSLRFFRGLHVLAAARDEESFGSLLRLSRRPEAELDELLGDGIYMGFARCLVSLFDGDAEALLAIASNPKPLDVVRSAALEAAIFLTWQQRIDRDLMRRFLVAFESDPRAENEAPIWYSWMQAVALLDFGNLAPMVEKAWKAGRIDRSIQDWSDFGTDLARARTAYDDVRRFQCLAIGTIDDVVEALEWTRHWTEADDDTEDVSRDVQELADWQRPAINPFRDVGRNDPCPCGSGKKAKKCCLSGG